MIYRRAWTPSTHKSLLYHAWLTWVMATHSYLAVPCRFLAPGPSWGSTPANGSPWTSSTSSRLRAAHNRIFEFKLPPSLQRKRGRGRPDLEPASCFCDATEAGNATREINHFAALDDEGADTAGSPGHRSASARFVETIDDRACLPYVLLFSTRAMHVEEEVTIDYGPSFFDAMQNTEEVESLKGKLKETERQLKVALEQLQAKDQQLKELLMAPRPQPMLLPDPGDVLQVRGPESRQALVNNCRCAPSGGLPCSYNCQGHVLYI